MRYGVSEIGGTLPFSCEIKSRRTFHTITPWHLSLEGDPSDLWSEYRTILGRLRIRVVILTRGIGGILLMDSFPNSRADSSYSKVIKWFPAWSCTRGDSAMLACLCDEVVYCWNRTVKDRPPPTWVHQETLHHEDDTNIDCTQLISRGILHVTTITTILDDVFLDTSAFTSITDSS